MIESKKIELDGAKLTVHFDPEKKSIRRIKNEKGEEVFGDLTSSQIQQIRKLIGI